MPAINLFPAVLLAGPPHAGKSALAYNLSIHLKKSQTPFILLRTTPDGEGDWFMEAEKNVGLLLRQKKRFTPQLVQRAVRAIEQRHLPMLVDVGGRPQGQQFRIFHACTHVILLYRTDSELRQWRTWLDETSLIPLAILRSHLHGHDEIISDNGPLQGVISGLDRFHPRLGEMFQRVLQRVQGVFDYPPGRIRSRHLSQAPQQSHIVVVEDLARQVGVPLTDRGLWWEPDHIPRALQIIPPAAPVALYGRGPAWLYAALASHALPASFHLFDARHFGWMKPPRVILNSARVTGITFTLQMEADVVRLKIVSSDRFLAPRPLHIPPLPAASGVILDGKAPIWLTSALVRGLARYYPHIHLYDPRLQAPVLVSERTPQGAVHR